MLLTKTPGKSQKCKGLNIKLIFHDDILVLAVSIDILTSLMFFYIQFKEVFKVLNDSKKAQFYARLSKPIGLLAGGFYAGIGFVPHDLNFSLHVYFANGAFLILFLLCILHSMTVYHSNLLNNQYVMGYLYVRGPPALVVR